MYQEIFRNLVVTFGEFHASPPIPLGDGNYARIQAVVFSTSSNNVSIFIDGSNDLENWDLGLGSVASIAGPLYRTFTSTTVISHQYVRIRAVQNTGGTSILSAGINICRQ